MNKAIARIIGSNLPIIFNCTFEFVPENLRNPSHFHSIDNKTTGNAIFRKTARNFNPPAAMCGRVCVMEVEELIEGIIILTKSDKDFHQTYVIEKRVWF